MELSLNTSLASSYKNKPQRARVMTEDWFNRNMYCPACPSDNIKTLPANTRVLDFECPECKEVFQLKSQSKPFGSSVQNSAYFPKIEKIKKGESPNWAFLEYNTISFTVTEMFIIPGHFMTVEAVKRRNPLRDTARRHGWVGSIIQLDRLPPDARLYVITKGDVKSPSMVRTEWKRFEFLQDQRWDTKGWLNDVLTCIRRLGKDEFSLQEVYAFRDELRKLHPMNKFVDAKIRQQLQVLRDGGIIEFTDPGHYRLKE